MDVLPRATGRLGLKISFKGDIVNMNFVVIRDDVVIY